MTGQNDSLQMQILIVDDEDEFRDECARLLSRLDCTILKAGNAEEAFSILQNESVSLMILDLRMPGIGGMEALKKIHELYPEIEVIMVSGWANTSDILDAMKLGACEFLTKPFDPKHLRSVVSRSIERKRLAEELKHLELERQELKEVTRKQEEQLTYSMRIAEMGEMAAAIAHNLNQPLTGIKNFAKNTIYMIDNNINNFDEIKENLNRVSQQVDRATKIINQMRELTRRSVRYFKPVDINSIIGEIVKFLAPQFKLADISVTQDLEPNLPLVNGDRIRLEQVFLNILINAKLAMEDTGDRRVEIKTRFDARSGLPVICEISDTGKGFGSEDNQKIFIPFFSNQTAGSGPGLGLPISESIIQQHKGTLEAFGVSGSGAKFVIKLPIPENESRAK